MKQEAHKERDPQGKRIVIFMGGEGSGKSTLGKLLASKIQKPFMSTGDIIRERARSDDGLLGEACRVMIVNNDYLDPKLIRQIISERLSNPDIENGIVIDGALRTLEETENFDDTLRLGGKGEFEINVIFLNVDEETGIQRRLNSSEKRPGETRETILIRLGKFKKDLDKRKQIVKERYRFFEIDANPPTEKVFANMLSVLEIKNE